MRSCIAARSQPKAGARRVGYTGRGFVSGRHRYRLSARSSPLERGFSKETAVTTKRSTKFLHEGQYAAEAEVELIESDSGWSPYLSVEDAEKLDEVREALRTGDLKKAGRLARVF
jgi:hypothetical protein